MAETCCQNRQALVLSLLTLDLGPGVAGVAILADDWPEGMILISVGTLPAGP